MIQTPEQTSDRRESMRSELQGWLRFVRGETHILRERPELLFQQAANQPNSTAPAQMAQRRFAAGLETRVWMKWIGKPRRPSSCLLTLTGHERGVTDCAFSPDGARILSASEDERLKWWDALTGAEMMSIEQDEKVTACDVSPDGARIVSGLYGFGKGVLDIRDAETGSRVMDLQQDTDGITLCAFSPDGKSLLAASYASINVWDLESETIRLSLKGHDDRINDCRFSPDSKFILSASNDRTIRLWDARTGAPLAVIGKCKIDLFEGVYSPDNSQILSWGGPVIKMIDPSTGFVLATFRKHEAAVSNCRFSLDGRLFASVSGDKTLKVWDAAAGMLLASLPVHTGIGGLKACAFSPDANQVVVAAEENLKTLDWRNARETAAMTGHNDWVKACAYSPDGKQILSASMDGTLKLWDAASGKELATFAGHGATVNDCAFSPDGKNIISASDDHTVRLWDIKSTQESFIWPEEDQSVDHCAFSPDGRRVLSYNRYNGWIKIWDAKSGTQVSAIETERQMTFCSFSADGAAVHTIGKNRALRIWDVDTGDERTEYSGHVDDVNTCAFSPDGTMFASGSTDGVLKLWDALSLAELKSFAGYATVRDLSFSPDGKQVLVSHGYAMGLLDPTTGKELAYFKGHSSGINACAFSPDGGRIISASDDHTLKIWDAVEASDGPGDDESRRVHTSTYSSDGSRIAYGFADGAIEICDAATGERVTIWAGHDGGVRFCQFSPDGRWVVSLGYNNDLKIWDPATATEKASFSCTGEPVFSPDGKWMMCGSNGAILKRYELATGALIEIGTGFSMQIAGCAFAPTARYFIAWSGNELKVWDAVTGSERAALDGLGSVHDWPDNYQYSPDGTRIICWLHQGLRRLLNAVTLKHVADLGGHVVVAHNLAFSPDSKLLVADNQNGVLKIWESATGKVLKQFPGPQSAPLESLVFSPDGKLILGACDDGAVQIWDAVSPAKAAVWRAHNHVSTASFSIDGERIVSCDDSSLKVWNKTKGADQTGVTLLCEFHFSAGRAADWVRALEAPLDGRRILLESQQVGRQLLEMVNLVPGPPVATAWRRKRKSQKTHAAAPGQAFDYAFKCPACVQWVQISVSDLDSRTTCANCGREVRINPSTIDADWRTLAGEGSRSRKRAIASIAGTSATKSPAKAAARKSVPDAKREETCPSSAQSANGKKEQTQNAPQDPKAGQRFDWAEGRRGERPASRGLLAWLKRRFGAKQ